MLFLIDLAMDTMGIYRVPLGHDATWTFSVDSLAHVGELEHAVDFDAPIGTPIVAARAGRVIELRDDSELGGIDPKYDGFANFVVIAHDNDEVSEYEHLEPHSVRVALGEVVEQGQPIGRVGSTGWSACPHLHFVVFGVLDHISRKIRFAIRCAPTTSIPGRPKH